MRLDTNNSYLPFGGITGLTYGNGLSLTQGYDKQYRISSVVTGSILNLAYGYDPNGNIISILDVVNPPGGEVLETPGAYSYQQGTNKLAHIEGTPPIDYGYDANGNITTENTWTYIYDLSNQLIRVQDNETTVAEYVYNGIGQRIKKNAQGSVRIFHYNHLGYLISETTETGLTLVEYVYVGNKLLAMIRGEQVYYYHTDHLGTPHILTDDTGTIAWKAVYTPFGEAAPSIVTVKNPFRFMGQYYDPETGLHYNYFRYYNPQTGRYITPDLLGLDGGINIFIYAVGNPINWVDPWGLLSEEYECYTKTGGSLSWRTNNPGNIIYGDWAKSHGAIGKSSSSKFSKFPSEEAGMKALKELLKDEYGDSTVKDAINKYAPAYDSNNPGVYVDFLKKNGINVDKKVNEQIDKLSEWIKQFEGWNIGTTKTKDCGCKK